MATSAGKKTSASQKSTNNTRTAGTRNTRNTGSSGNTSNNKKTGTRSNGNRNTGSRQSTGTKRNYTKRTAPVDYRKESEMFHEIGLIIFFIAMVILFLCNFGLIGPVGNAIRGILFGIFGLTAYIVPVVLFIGVTFWYANTGNPHAIRKLFAGTFLFIMAGVVCDLISQNAINLTTYDAKLLYDNCSNSFNGGGVLAGSLTYVLNKYLGFVGTVLVVVLCSAVSFILMTERSLITGVRDGGSRMLERSREESERRREYVAQRRLEQEEIRLQREEERSRRDEERARREMERLQREEERETARRMQQEAIENEKILRREKRVSGVAMDTTIPKKEDMNKRRDDIHEITYNEADMPEAVEEVVDTVKKEVKPEKPQEQEFDFDRIRVRSAHQVRMQEVMDEQQTLETEPDPVSTIAQTSKSKPQPQQDMTEIRVHSEHTVTERTRPVAKPAPAPAPGVTASDMQIAKDVEAGEKKIPKKYMFPPLSRLQKGAGSSADNTQELKETAMRLQQTLNTFGVRVTVTDISQGPSVTRYELQPEQGVKVSKIVSLSDDIKLNLAATDIRIEAPIPGKAAIGIEVPNKETMGVALRDLFETKEFREFPSNIAFAVGKDIAGQTVVTDIAKMPHMLIAGATGSGKSVCINTLIMSILYKAHPDDVKLIMVDPKVVELSVYNGIPHLLIPVVTDPKKASAALHWAVSEMNDRYAKFADYNVRDLAGYNRKVEAERENGDENAPAKLPQIVIIVDVLADLMMVAPGEVEESICRLAQLARACGIHLIIATQRPSVDVITGLIKANMPSRVAFSVSSGVDSRTILDMNGAEKLLGKGDMLFYPQGYSKPARVQGAFVSDKEVSDVVDFLKNQAIGNTYAEDIEAKLKNISSSGGGGGSTDGTSGGNGLDEYFVEAGKFIIDKDKASIGMLQRMFRIGFNRAARIMDQLCEYGVVGEEEGTKPRKVLMSMEQFEQLIEEVV